MTRRLPPAVGLLLLGGSMSVTANVRQNGDNCEGVKSCRPRCITFQIERDISSCGLLSGVFTVQDDVNPWDTKRFNTLNCMNTGTCTNNLCGLELNGDLTIRVGETGHHGSFFYTTYSLPDGGDDRFTHCSMYPCTKEECSVPEQMGLELQFSFFSGAVRVDDFDAVPLIIQELFLKAAFVGSPILHNVENRFGPMRLEWMDDPTACRVGHLPIYAPVAPPLDPITWTTNAPFQQSLYCEGEEYLPGPLPALAPTFEPSTAPSRSPSHSISPSSAPSHTAIGLEQMGGLRNLYDATLMSEPISREVHNWFKSDDYCRFTGVTCDERGYVILLDMTDRRLAGTIPPSLDKLGRLRQLKLVNNRILGAIPNSICNLLQLTQIELGVNQLTGTIPTCLHRLRHLRRLLLQFNDLTGTIPDEFCQFNQLMAFDIAGNAGMYGSIPQCMGSLPLDFIRVDNVGLVGSVPPLLCSRKSMNGLSPNPYGCNAIACPAGTYEPTLGRSYKAGTPCLDCEVPSNVIGSTNCRYVVNNTVVARTNMPSTSPTLSPSMPTHTETPTHLPSFIVPTFISPSVVMPSVSNLPSMALLPVADGTYEPSLSVSNFSSISLSASPSLLPSSQPSFAPSFKPTPKFIFVEVTVAFADVDNILEGDNVQKLVWVTKSYLHASNVTAESVVLMDQSIGNTTTSGARIMRHNASRRLLRTALLVDFQISGENSDDTFAAGVEFAMVNQFSNYSAYVQEALPILTPAPFVPVPAPTLPPSRVKEQNEFISKPRAGSSVNWWLLGSAITLSVVAVAAVLIVRQSRRRASRDRSRLFPVEQTAVTPSTDFPTRVHNDGFGDDALSHESSSGWNSTSSGGEHGDNDEEFVVDTAVKEWTSAPAAKSVGIHSISRNRIEDSEEELI